MSYCVNCGVELHVTASGCPLCQTPVINPNAPVDGQSPTPFPTKRVEVAPVSKPELAILISAMLASVAVCCGALNLFLQTGRGWSLYVIGAAVMFWIWFVPPLLAGGMGLLLRLVLDVAAVAIYVFLISLDLKGTPWFMGLALPIILWGGALILFLGLVAKLARRSVLTSITLVVASLGTFLLGVEFFIDRWLYHSWNPSWSLVLVAICLGIIIPLVVIRRVRSLREEVRRRFHM